MKLMWIRLYSFLFFLATPCIAKQDTSWFTYVPFDLAMKKDFHLSSILATKNFMETIDGWELYSFFKRLFEKYNPLNIKLKKRVTIPRIIHQIWLGSSVPEVYKQYMQSWIDHHPEWEYKLWTDENVHEITLYNQDFFDATANYGAKSDILRWEILYQFGGLYVDMDYECLASFEPFHHRYDFYTGIQPLDTFMIQLGAALVGSRPGHPILKHCIETIKDDWHLKGAPKKTGPIHFTKSFYLFAGKDGSIDIALPAFYVYPLGSQEAVQEASMQKWIKQGSFAVHWWSKSWMPKEYRPMKFRNIHNTDTAVHWND